MKSTRHGFNKLFEGYEIAVMSRQPPRELPDPFQAIEFWAVGWKEVQAQDAAVSLEPWD
jgi:hypothetical protein